MEEEKPFEFYRQEYETMTTRQIYNKYRERYEIPSLVGHGKKWLLYNIHNNLLKEKEADKNGRKKTDR